MGFGFGMGLDMFGIMFAIVFVLVIGMFIVTAVKGIGQWSKNNNSPRLTVPVIMVVRNGPRFHVIAMAAQTVTTITIPPRPTM